ncbi:MAG: molecular chaperone DnaJ, partial [Candidatus Niyogibacteria bacterium]|nr:molecular chaperone DnaJ [Candidatus Niyogibacteria bacterium]
NNMSDYYQTLGIQRGASKDDVKKAYRKLAHRYHPDKKGGDEKKFKEISEAYYVLSDDKRRAQYDQYGRVFSSAGGAQSGFDPNMWQNMDFGQGFGGFSDIFEDFFGFGRRGTKRQKRGRDISIDIEIPFQDSIFGTTRNVLLRKTGECRSCQGSGTEPGSKTDTCKTCNGSGTVREQKQSFFGAITMLRECSVCHGKGTVPEKKCKQCKGKGIDRSEEEISVTVPAGIENGEMIGLSGQGEAVAGGVSGDLYVKVHVSPHSFLKRKGEHLLMDLDIPLTDALLGTEKVIESVDGKIKIKVPAGVDSGEILRVRGRGVPVAQNQRGDLLIRVLVRNPKELSRKAKKLIEELREEGI